MRQLGWPELWVYDSGKLTIYLFEGGQYVASDTSAIFANGSHCSV